MTPIRIPFPMQGLNEDTALTDQPSMSSPDLQNVRAYDPETGRARGGQRPGLSKYLSTQVNGSRGVQCLGRAYASVSEAMLMAVSDRTNDVIYVASHMTTPQGVRITKSSATGTVWDIEVTGVTSSASTFSGVSGMCVSGSTLYVWFDSVDAISESAVYRFNTSDGSAVSSNPWINETDDSIPAGASGIQYHYDTTTRETRVKSCMVALNSRLFLLGKSGNNIVLNSRTLSSGATDTSVTVLTATGSVTAPLRLISTAGLTTGTDQIVALAHESHSSFTPETQPTAGSYTEALSQNWNATPVSGNSADAIRDIAWHPRTSLLQTDGSIVACGKSLGSGNQEMAALSSVNGSISFSYGTIGWAEIETFENHATLTDNGGGAFYSETVTVYGRANSSDNVYFSFSTTSQPVSGPAVTTSETRTITVAQDDMGGAIGVLHDPEDFEFQFNHQFRDVDTLYAISGGKLQVGTSSGLNDPVSGASNRFSVARQQVFSQQLGDHVYFADGSNAYRFNASTSTLEAWTASAGSLPTDSSGNTPTLIEAYEGRIVLSGLPADRRNWFMSKIGDGRDFDYSADFGAQRAVAGNNADAGLVPDVVNGMVPMDGQLLFGGDHSIYALRGNPLLGGSIIQVTNITGMAFGRAWCIDPEGSVWFIGSRGSLYRMSVGGRPERISLRTIDDRLTDIDTSTHIIRLAWDDERVGIWIGVTPLAGTLGTHYFYDVRTNGFFKDVLGSLNYDPMSMLVFDGVSATDRSLLLGCRDGYIRKLDSSAKDDDGTAIDSYAVIGPVQQEDAVPVILHNVSAVLDSTSSDVDWSVLSGESADAARSASASYSGTWVAGRNYNERPRVGGHAVYVKVRNNTVNESWALERIDAVVKPTSMRFRGQQ